MASPLIEFLKGRKCQGFIAHPVYSSEGDFLTYYFCDEDCVAERIDDVLTVYVSDEQEIVGFKLKGIRELLKRLGEFCLGVFDGDGHLKLGMLFLATGLYAEPAAQSHYRRFAEQTKQVPLPFIAV